MIYGKFEERVEWPMVLNLMIVFYFIAYSVTQKGYGCVFASQTIIQPETYSTCIKAKEQNIIAARFKFV